MNARVTDFILHMVIACMLFVSLIPDPSNAVFAVATLQFLVGIFQLISSIIRMTRFHSFDKTIQQLLIGYWILCAVYLVGVSLAFNTNNSTLKGVAFFSAWGIAVYYSVITYLLAFPRYKKSHLEI